MRRRNARRRNARRRNARRRNAVAVALGYGHRLREGTGRTEKQRKEEGQSRTGEHGRPLRLGRLANPSIAPTYGHRSFCHIAGLDMIRLTFYTSIVIKFAKART